MDMQKTTKKEENNPFKKTYYDIREHENSSNKTSICYLLSKASNIFVPNTVYDIYTNPNSLSIQPRSAAELTAQQREAGEAPDVFIRRDGTVISPNNPVAEETINNSSSDEIAKSNNNSIIKKFNDSVNKSISKITSPISELNQKINTYQSEFRLKIYEKSSILRNQLIDLVNKSTKKIDDKLSSKQKRHDS